MLWDPNELDRRLRWEQARLNEALRGRRDLDPDARWAPDGEVLDQARRLLRAGGTDAPRRPVLDALRQERLAPVVSCLPRLGEDTPTVAAAAAEQDAAALVVSTRRWALGGGPGEVEQARTGFKGPLVSWSWPADEGELAVQAALGVDAVVARPLPPGPLGSLLSVATAYGLVVVVEVHDPGALLRAVELGARAILLHRWGEEDDGAAVERSCRLLAGLPDDVVALGAGATTLRRALALRRAGADAALLPAALLDRDLEELTEPDDDGPAQPELDSVLADLGVEGFVPGPGGLFVPGVAAPEPTVEPAAAARGPLDLLAVRQPRGLRI